MSPMPFCVVAILYVIKEIGGRRRHLRLLSNATYLANLVILRTTSMFPVISFLAKNKLYTRFILISLRFKFYKFIELA